MIAGAAAVSAGVLEGLSAGPGTMARASGAPEPPDAALGVAAAAHWRPLAGKRVQCALCPRECAVADLERGYCGVRENRGGAYYTLVYGRPSAAHVDPVEKKPLFHYLPGTTAYSVGTAGCNMECLFCQNWNLSQFRPEQLDAIDLPPGRLIDEARDSGCALVAHTYNEPTAAFEYVRDAAKAGRDAGIPAVMISNGYIQREPMVELCRSLGAVKIDLKAFTDAFYVETCHGRLAPVLETLKTLKAQGVWFEIVVLLITGRNDSADEVKRLSAWVAGTLSPDVPLHFSRYFPAYRLRLPQTPVDVMARAWDAASAEGLRYVYVGNVELPGKADTLCPSCGAVVVKRLGFVVLSNALVDGKCPSCGRAIPGVWKKEDAFRRNPPGT